MFDKFMLVNPELLNNKYLFQTTIIVGHPYFMD